MQISTVFILVYILFKLQFMFLNCIYMVLTEERVSMSVCQLDTNK